MKNIAILMASYNGEKYIKEQIDSIIGQTYKDWDLYVRDDGSNDSTVEIIKSYERDYPNIHLLDDKEKHIGAKNSFMKLLSAIESDYYMFCDQDDIWLPTKIERSVNLLEATEKEHSNIPIIVHTDVTVVDGNLNVLSQSYWRSAHIKPERYKSYNYLAIFCCVQGTTMLFNKLAKQVCYPLAEDVRMHDFWVATRVIKNGGLIASLYEQTVLYRQHSNNVYGVSFGDSLKLSSKLKSIKEVIAVNTDKYNYLRKDGYGNIFKFLWFRSRIFINRFVLDRK